MSAAVVLGRGREVGGGGWRGGGLPGSGVLYVRLSATTALAGGPGLARLRRGSSAHTVASHGPSSRGPAPGPSPPPCLPHPVFPPPHYRSLCAGASSHKTSSPSRILTFYYWRPVLTIACLLNELFFLTLYLLHFLSSTHPARAPVAALATVAAPVAVAKQVVSAWQVVAAHRLMGASGGRSD